MPPTNSANEIAAWFVGNIDRDAGDSITHLKLQKLVYYAQAWSLALRGAPLFEEDLQAWAHGPVAESVYKVYRGAGWDALPPPEQVPEVSAEVAEHLSSILATYGDFSAKHLERMTHSEAPWLEARGNLPLEARSSSPISKDLMGRFYNDLYERVDDEERAA
ncbi:hypothetical protein MBUL_04456 (plasmid) [Methylobacterium bullatum]|uniref:Antitoxin SocA-like Panacea domain-containing protein n=1 Tax=Methylobacterium bullatum TaxID=570505 RepID=A0A679JRT5_9HYPH|nr:hypothetical protein MBUL_04456 [Methylobacterium bullatum]